VPVGCRAAQGNFAVAHPLVGRGLTIIETDLYDKAVEKETSEAFAVTGGRPVCLEMLNGRYEHL